MLERLIARRKSCAVQYDNLKRSIAIVDEEERASLMQVRSIIFAEDSFFARFLSIYILLFSSLQLFLQAPNQRESEKRASKRISLIGQREEVQVICA